MPARKPAVPKTQTDKGGNIDRISAAEKMFGTGSPQHKAAIRRWGKK